MVTQDFVKLTVQNQYKKANPLCKLEKEVSGFLTFRTTRKGGSEGKCTSKEVPITSGIHREKIMIGYLHCTVSVSWSRLGWYIYPLSRPILETCFL